jgi:hypothetical protein
VRVRSPRAHSRRPPPHAAVHPQNHTRHVQTTNAAWRAHTETQTHTTHMHTYAVSFVSNARTSRRRSRRSLVAFYHALRTRTRVRMHTRTHTLATRASAAATTPSASIRACRTALSHSARTRSTVSAASRAHDCVWARVCMCRPVYECDDVSVHTYTHARTLTPVSPHRSARCARSLRARSAPAWLFWLHQTARTGGGGVFVVHVTRARTLCATIHPNLSSAQCVSVGEQLCARRGE